MRQLLRKIDRNSAPQGAVECSATHTAYYLVASSVVFLAVCDRPYPRDAAFGYLDELSREFLATSPQQRVHDPAQRPYAFMDFDTFVGKTRQLFADGRAAAGSGNLNRLNSELKDVTSIMTKNIEDLLYRGDSLERMGEVSSRLREDSKKYRRAAVRINWELLLKQYGPFGALGLIVIFFLWFRFF